MTTTKYLTAAVLVGLTMMGCGTDLGTSSNGGDEVRGGRGCGRGGGQGCDGGIDGGSGSDDGGSGSGSDGGGGGSGSDGGPTDPGPVGTPVYPTAHPRIYLTPN